MKKHSVRSLLLALTLFLLPLVAACTEKTPEINPYIRVFEEGNLSFGVTDEAAGTCAVLGFAGKETARAEIPASAGGFRVTEIATSAFCNCETLEEAAIPAGVVRIGDNAFYGCVSLREAVLPQGVERICWNAFYGCESLRRAVLPPSLAAVERNAFYGCKRLSRVEIADLAGWCAVSFEFYHDEFCSNPLWYAKDLTVGGELLTNLAVPAGVTEIGNSAFCNCKSLKTVSFPSGLTRVGNYAFANCAELTAVDLPESVSEIGERAFFSCAALESATLGGAQKVAPFAFAECAKLKNIKFPANVRQVEQFVLAGCSALETIDLPESVEKIDMGAFRLCGNLREIRFAGTVEQWRAIDKVVFDPDSIYADLDWDYGWSFNTNVDYVICSDGTAN